MSDNDSRFFKFSPSMAERNFAFQPMPRGTGKTYGLLKAQARTMDTAPLIETIRFHTTMLPANRLAYDVFKAEFERRVKDGDPVAREWIGE